MSTVKPYFAYSTAGGMEFFASEEEALACAKEQVDLCLDENNHWDDDVGQIYTGVITHHSVMKNKTEPDNDSVAYYCDYEIERISNQ